MAETYGVGLTAHDGRKSEAADGGSGRGPLNELTTTTACRRMIHDFSSRNGAGRCGSAADRERPTAMAVIIPPRSAVNLWLQIGLILKERRWTCTCRDCACWSPPARPASASRPS